MIVFRLIVDVMDLGSKDTTPAQIVAVFNNVDRKLDLQLVLRMMLHICHWKLELRWLQHQREQSTVSSGDLEQMVL